MTTLPERTAAFCERFRLRVPILLAPMAGIPAPLLSIAVAEAGGLGACGAVLMSPAQITAWVSEVRAKTAGGFQLNLWIPDPPPVRDAAAEHAVRRFLNEWGPTVAADAADATPPDFTAQCEAVLAARPVAASSVMGLFPAALVAQLRTLGVAWFATVTTVAEAELAEAAGADVIVAQGMEAGGHRGSFDARQAETQQVGLFALLPAVVDAVRLPVVAAGGIADSRGVAAALMLGASAVQMGTAFLRCPEAGIAPAWASALGVTRPEGTVVSRVFSGRAGRSIATGYVRAATEAAAPRPAPYPVQRGLTGAMRAAASQAGDLERMQAWAGQSAALARAAPAAAVVRSLWEDAARLLGIEQDTMRRSLC
jgi:nitronate monooxygenase